TALGGGHGHAGVVQVVVGVDVVVQFGEGGDTCRQPTGGDVVVDGGHDVRGPPGDIRSGRRPARAGRVAHVAQGGAGGGHHDRGRGVGAEGRGPHHGGRLARTAAGVDLHTGVAERVHRHVE